MDRATAIDGNTRVVEPALSWTLVSTRWKMVYVGVSVGETVGALLGEALGLGVGTANTNASVVVPLTVAVLLRVTVCVPVFTAVTVVPSGMPVPVIKLPMEIDATEVTEVTLALPTVVVPLLTVVTTL
jgi:hypothetical protein